MPSPVSEVKPAAPSGAAQERDTPQVQAGPDATNQIKDLPSGHRRDFLDGRKTPVERDAVLLASDRPISRDFASELFNAGKSTIEGLASRAQSHAVDTSIQLFLGSHGIDAAQSRSIAEIATRIPAEQLAEVGLVLNKLATATPEERLDVLRGNHEKLGITRAQLDTTASALFEAGLGFVRDRTSLTHQEVKSMRELFQLNQSLAGKDGIFDRRDIASLSASLTVNDLKTLSEAHALVVGTIMSEVQREACAVAHATKRAHPDYQKAVDYSDFRFIFRNGPISRMVRQEAHNGIALGNAMANQGAREAVSQISANLANDFPDIAKVCTALETRNALAEHFGQSDASSNVEQQKAYTFFNQLAQRSPAEIFRKGSPDGTLYEQAQEHFLKLDREQIEGKITESLKAHRDLKGEARQTLDGIKRFLDLAANQDLREGITRQSLDGARHGEAMVQRVVDKTVLALNATRDAEGRHFQIPLGKLTGITEKCTGGRIGPVDALNEIRNQAIATGRELFIPLHSQDGATDALVKKFVDQGILRSEHLRSQENLQNFSAYEVQGKQYLGYLAKDASGKELFCYVDQTKSSTGSHFLVMSGEHQKAYKDAIAASGDRAGSPATLSLNDLARENYTHRIARQNMPHSASVGAAATVEAREEFLAKNHAAAFRYNGVDYLGYLTNDKQLALVGPDGKTSYIRDQGQKLAYYGALVRDDRVTAEVEALAAFSGGSGTIESSNPQRVTSQSQAPQYYAPQEQVYATPRHAQMRRGFRRL